MSFLVLLAVLLVEKFTALRPRLQRDRTWLGLLRRCETALAWPWLRLAVPVLLPLVAAGLVLRLAGAVAYGWLALPLHLALLLYSLGRVDPRPRLGAFGDAWRRGDVDAARLAAERDLGAAADAPAALLVQARRYLIWHAFQGFFVVLFWYVLLGPLAALAYRLLALAAAHADTPGVRERAVQLRHAFEWLPARLLAAAFALVGHFSAAVQALLPDLLHWETPADALLLRCGLAAADVGAPDEAGGNAAKQAPAALDTLWALLVRAAVLGYASVAIITILS